MWNERWPRLEPLLDAALDVEPRSREAFAKRICADDHALLADLLALLSDCERGASLFNDPAVIQYEPLLGDALPPVIGGRYRITRELARGGMGTVYVADDPRHARQVAVKVLHAHVARMIGRERFVREIEIAARLSHPHILPLHDSGQVTTVDGTTALFYVSPFIPGESLRGRMQRGNLPLDEALRLGREVAQALDFAHRQGVVHLDVKPENILLQDGHAIVCDFGIAHAMSDAQAPSVAAAPLLGTPSYMSPEHARGDCSIDGRSDIYSLGCMLFEMIVGRRPRQGAGGGMRALRAELASASTRHVANVIAAAMSVERDERFDSAAAFAAALGSAAASSLPRWRRPTMAAAIAGALLALVTAAHVRSRV